MKILITGGAGFIGSHLADRLIADGHHVTVLDNYETGSPDNLTAHKRLHIVEGSVANESLVSKLFSEVKPEIVVHAAASYKNPEAWGHDVLTNSLGTANVVRASQAVKASKIIYFQTSLCYGLKPEEQPVTLKSPINPSNSSYAISKTGGEQFVMLSGIPYASFRLANAYGPRNLSGPLPTFFQRLSTSKPCFVMDTRRDFIFIDDLIQVVLGSINGKGGTGVYHISSGHDVSIKELFDETLSAMGITLDRPVEVRPRGADDAATILLDPSRTEKDFSWKASTPLKMGIKKAIEWYKQREIRETYTHLKIEKSH